MASKKAAKKSVAKKPPAKKAPAKKAPAKKAPAKKKAPARGKGLRRDYEVYNESTGFVVTSLAACGTIDGGDKAWDKAAKGGAFLPIELVQDDPLLVRVVLGPLRPEEEEAAIGRVAHRVRVEDGKLVLGGGRELLEEGLEDYREYAQVVDVPPGEYRVTVLATAHGLVGGPLLERAKRAKVGAWWRETRGKAAMPGWVARTCHAHTKLDPGHEDEWADEPETDEDELLLDFVVHLEPLEGAPPAPPKLDGGFVSFGGWTVAAPTRCPAGLLAVKPAKSPEPMAQADAGPAARVELGLESRLGGARPQKIKGGPVSLPLDRLADLFRLAYLADADACFELRLEAPAGKKPPKLPAREHVNADVEGLGLRLSQGGEGGRWFALREVAAAGAALAKAKLPDGTTVDLLGAPETPGRGQRWRGVVKKGQLLVGKSTPAVDAATLSDALVLSAETAKGQALVVRSDAEAKGVLADPEVKEMVPELVHEEGALRLPEADPGLLHFAATALFRVRFGSVFACAPPEAQEDDGAEQALQDALQAVSAKVAKTTLAGGIVHHGVSGNFHKFDLATGRPLEAEHVKETDRQLARTGFVVVGDLVSSRFPEVVIRGYARADGDGDTWGALLCGLLESKFEFVTEIVTDDGDAWLTTSLERAKDDPEKRLYRTGCPDLNFRKLQPLHDRHRARKQTLGGRPRQAPRDPVALAAAIDRSLCRQLGLAKPLED